MSRGIREIGDNDDNVLDGTEDRDILVGKGGDDLLSGKGDADKLRAGADDDTVFGGAGDDRIFAAGGDDLIDGGDDNDWVRAGHGDDIVFGRGGMDQIRGESGDDMLRGGSDEDRIRGDDGNDMIEGGRDDDRLRGGDGFDAFMFNPNRKDEGDDVIADFEFGTDKVVLDVADVLAATSGLAEFVIANGGNGMAVLAGLDASEDWSLGANGRGDLVVDHPNGSITFRDLAADGITSFMQIGEALAVTGLGEALAGLADAAGNPDTVADLVAASGGMADDNGSDFDLLGMSLDAAGLTEALDDPEASFTVFAPDDDAFISLANRLGYEGSDEAGAFQAIVDTLTTLGEGDPIPLLTDVLTFHVAPEARTLGELQLDREIDPLFDADLLIDGMTVVDQDPDLADAMVTIPDIQTGNATVHVVNEVLLPFDI